MDIPEILQGSVHLPLTATTTVAEAVQLANGFYQTQLDAASFKEATPEVNVEGRLVLLLVEVGTENPVIHFVNKNTIVPATLKALINPLAKAVDQHDWLAPSVQLTSAEEIDFLDELGSGRVYPLDSANTLPWRLAQLLNEYGVAGRWMAGTFAELSTAGFELVYKGPSAKAPEEFLVDASPMVAIIRTHHGDRKGYLCLKS